MTSLLPRLAGLLALLTLGIVFSLQMDAHPHDGWSVYSHWFLGLWAALLLWSFLACGVRRTACILALLAGGSALAAWALMQQGSSVCSWGDVGNVALCAAGFSCFAWVLRRFLVEARATARSCRVAELVLLPALLLAGLAAAFFRPSDDEVRARLATEHPGAPVEWNAAQRCFRVSDGKDAWVLYNASGERLRPLW